MPFKPGDSRINRDGRPKTGTAMTDILKKAIEEVQQLRDSEGNPIEYNK